MYESNKRKILLMACNLLIEHMKNIDSALLSQARLETVNIQKLFHFLL